MNSLKDLNLFKSTMGCFCGGMCKAILCRRRGVEHRDLQKNLNLLNSTFILEYKAILCRRRGGRTHRPSERS